MVIYYSLSVLTRLLSLNFIYKNLKRILFFDTNQVLALLLVLY